MSRITDEELKLRRQFLGQPKDDKESEEFAEMKKRFQELTSKAEEKLDVKIEPVKEVKAKIEVADKEVKPNDKK